MELDHARQRLEEERTRLSEVREGFDGLHTESEADSLAELSNMDQHPADVGTETFEREKDLSILETVEAELADIEHAMRRIEEGSYGTCEACGKPIGDDRLEVLPAARFCVEDQATAEREARAPGAAGPSGGAGPSGASGASG
jgi:RNA polymerase-binding transcription factor DksA